MDLLKPFRRKAPDAPAVKAARDGVIGFRLDSSGRMEAIKAGDSYWTGGVYYSADQYLSNSATGLAYALVVSVWAFRAVNVCADAIAGLRWRVVDKDSREELPDHPLARALRRNEQKLLRKWQWSMKLWGEVFVEKTRNRANYPAGLNWLNNLGVTVDASTGYIRKFMYSAPGGANYAEFDPHEMIFAHTDNPFDDLRGLSPFLTIMDELGIDRDVARVTRAFYANDARPGILLVPENAMSPADATRFMDTWKAQFQGPDKAGKPALLERKVSVIEVQRAPTLDDAGLRESVRREICAAFGVPLSLVDTGAEVTYENKLRDQQWFAESRVIPDGRDIAADINAQAMPFFDASGDAEFEFVFDEIKALSEDALRQTQLTTQRLGAGLITLNEARDAEGLEPLPAGNVLYLGGQPIPVAQLDQMPLAPAPPPVAAQATTTAPHLPAPKPKLLTPGNGNGRERAEWKPATVVRGVTQRQKARPVATKDAGFGFWVSLANNGDLAALWETLFAVDPDADWLAPAEWHLSLCYAAAPQPRAAMTPFVDFQDNYALEPTTVAAERLEVWDTEDGACLVLRVAANDALRALQAECVGRMIYAGLIVSDYSQPEDWKPHVTLAYNVADGLLDKVDAEAIVAGVRLPIEIVQLVDDAPQYTWNLKSVADELAAWEKVALKSTRRAQDFECYVTPPATQAVVRMALAELPAAAGRDGVRAVFAAARQARKEDAVDELPFDDALAAWVFNGAKADAGDIPAHVRAVARMWLKLTGDNAAALDEARVFARRWAGKSFAQTEIDYHIALVDLVMRAFQTGAEGGPAVPRKEFGDLGRAEIRAYLTQGFIDGMHDAGAQVDSADDLTDEARAEIHARANEEAKYWTKLANELYGDMLPQRQFIDFMFQAAFDFQQQCAETGDEIACAEAEKRLASANRAFDEFKMAQRAFIDRMAVWVNKGLGNAFELGKLFAQDNQLLIWVYGDTIEHCASCRVAEGQIHTAREWREAGVAPKQSNLECHGDNCDCGLIPAPAGAEPRGDLSAIPLFGGG